MPLQIHKAWHKRSGYLPPSGSIVESILTPTVTFLAKNTAQVSDPSSTPTGVPLVSSSVLDGASTAVPSPTSSASSSTSSGNQISLGTVIGACAAAAIAFLLAIGLAFYCSKRHNRSPAYSKSRNAVNNASRRRSHLESWEQMDDGDRPEGQGQSVKQQPSGFLGTMFHRTISDTSAEKSSEHNRESVGTMHHFSKYHPGLAAEMASQRTGEGAGGEIAKPSPAFHLIGRGSNDTPPTSWDGETVRGDSVSLHPSLYNSVAPHTMAKEKSTPPAITSLHRWESAEVLHVSQVYSDISDVGEPRNPFANHASSIKNDLQSRNPFFSAQDHPTRRILPNTHQNPFADSDFTRESTAIQSLIAALGAPHRPDGGDRIVSVQSSVYSRGSVDDGDSAISVTAFPYPPTQVRLR